MRDFLRSLIDIFEPTEHFIIDITDENDCSILDEFLHGVPLHHRGAVHLAHVLVEYEALLVLPGGLWPGFHPVLHVRLPVLVSPGVPGIFQDLNIDCRPGVEVE